MSHCVEDKEHCSKNTASFTTSLQHDSTYSKILLSQTNLEGNPIQVNQRSNI